MEEASSLLAGCKIYDLGPHDKDTPEIIKELKTTLVALDLSKWKYKQEIILEALEEIKKIHDS